LNRHDHAARSRKILGNLLARQNILSSVDNTPVENSVELSWFVVVAYALKKASNLNFGLKLQKVGLLDSDLGI